VALSGGVDSATAAARLCRAGHDVIGVTLRFADLSSCGLGASRCCSPGDLERAARVCWQLGIPHHAVDAGEPFQHEVIEPFVEAYLDGRTPSPCVRCNSRVKLGALVPFARQVGAEAVATGHYARCDADGQGRARLWRGVDAEKDQSYFLFDLSREQLGLLRLPIGDSSKAEVRAEAAALGLASAAQPDSQEICFVPADGSYVQVLETLAGDRLPPAGDIVDGAGRVLGRHNGVHLYTVGQRTGLGVATGERLYVVALDVTDNRVVLGRRGELERRCLDLEQVNWLLPEDPTAELRASVQVRSRHRPASASIRPLPGHRAEVQLDEPVSAPAPGQAAVFYDGERVLGGGWIVRTS
jgi:tRNA-specific 2-thiouridylase